MRRLRDQYWLLAPNQRRDDRIPRPRSISFNLYHLLPSHEPSDDLPHVPVVRVEPPPRPRGFIQSTQDLNDPLDEMSSLIGTMPSISRFSHGDAWPSIVLHNLEEREESAEASSSVAWGLSSSFKGLAVSSSLSPTPTRAATAVGRRTALQTSGSAFRCRRPLTPVTTKSGVVKTRANQSGDRSCSTT